MIFKGMYEHTLDAQGRVFIPSKFRTGEQTLFVACEAFYTPTIWLFTEEYFDAIADRMGAFNLLDEEAQAIERKLYATASDVVTDKKGRIQLPQHLLDYAGLDRDVVISGVRSHIEIWSKERWLEQMKDDNTSFARSVAKLRESGVRF